MVSEVMLNISIGIVAIIMVVWTGLSIADGVNEGAKETREYCDAHPEVELWANQWGITNCTAWRENKVVTLI
jgi:hypothetical protein